MGNHIKTLLAFESAKTALAGKEDAAPAELSYATIRDRIAVTRPLNDMTLTRTLTALEEKGEIERIPYGYAVRYRLTGEVSPDRLPELARGLVEEAIRGAIGVGIESRLRTENWAIYGVPRDALPRFRRTIRKPLERLQGAIDDFLDSEVDGVCGWLRTCPELRGRGAEIRAARDSLLDLVEISADARFLFETNAVGWKVLGLDPTHLPEKLVDDDTKVSFAEKLQPEAEAFIAKLEPLRLLLGALKPRNRKAAAAKVAKLQATARWATLVVR
ncbi:MAG: hypothetical protein ABSE66_02740 [Thermoplasmata archaeon]|jgi:hypothetical protein